MNFVGTFFTAIYIVTSLKTALASSLYRSSGEETVCETEICKESANQIRNFMNKSADPCTNFYEYACGGWIASHPIPPSKPKYTALGEVKEKIDKQVEDALSSPPDASINSKAVKNAQSLYRACVDDENRGKEGVQPVIEYLEKFGGWPLLNPSGWDGSNYKWSDMIARLIRKLYLDACLVLLPDADVENPDYNIIYIYPPTFQAGKDEMINMAESDRTIEIIAAYKAYIIKSAELLGAEVNDDLKQAVEDLVNFESSLAKLTVPNPEKSGETEERMTVAELQKTISDSIDWKAFINTVLEGYTPVEDSTEMYVLNVDYLKQMIPLVESTNIKTVANYISWKIVAKVDFHSTAEFRDAEFQFDKVVKGIEEPDPLEKSCVTQTNTILTHAVGRLYVDMYFSKAEKEDIENLAKNLRKAFKQTLSELTWMDDDTKKLAIEKLEAVTSEMVYPDWIMDDKELDKYYEDVVIPELNDKTYFKSLMAAVEGLFGGRYFKIWNEKRDTKGHMPSPSNVNAGYEPSVNAIIYPAGIFNAPFYQYKRLPSMNYGAIGGAIGRELNHVFDSMGSQYDKKGDFEDWWTDVTRTNFKEKAKCFQDQYSSYVEPITGLNLKGKVTYEEDIADNGGLRNAYKAYKIHLEETGNAAQRLPNINATSDQLFYLSFASIYCGSETKESLEKTIEEDWYSPEPYRVMGSLSNSEDFAKAFNCDKGTPMNPADKCIAF